MTLKFDKPAVLLEGGPRDGWAYFEDEIERLVTIERYCGRELGYRPTERFAVHPRTGGRIQSRVWEYVPPSADFADSAADPWAELDDPWAGT